MLDAWKYLLGIQDKPVDDEESVLEGITRIDGIESYSARQFAKLDFWPLVQTEPGERAICKA